MARLFQNNASGTLAASATAAATQLTLSSGHGSRFPMPTASDQFSLTLIGESGGAELSWEIVLVTARSGDVLTVTRAQEGTTAASWAIGARVELRWTAGAASLFPQFTSAGHLPVGGSVANLIGTAGRALTISAGVAGDSFSALELQGSTTFENGPFANINFWLKNERISFISARRASTDSFGNLGFFVKAAGGGALTEYLTISSNNGNVGIFNTSPQQKLDIIGSGRATGSFAVGGSLATGYQFCGEMRAEGTTDSRSVSFHADPASVGADSFMRFCIDGVEYARLSAEGVRPPGRLGLGVTAPVGRVDAVTSDNCAYLARASEIATPAIASVVVTDAWNLNLTARAQAVYKGHSHQWICDNQIVALRLDNVGNLGVGTDTPSAMLDVNSNTIRLRSARTPASATATGNPGDICWNSSYIYVCVAENSWKRSALASW